MWKVNRGDETPEELAALQGQRRRMRAPENEVGGLVTIEPPVFASADCALQLEVIRVFSSGLLLQFRVLVRTIRPRHSEPGLRAPSILGMSRSGDDALWVGVKLSNGHGVSNAGGRPPDVDLPRETTTLARAGGSGNDNSASLTYFLSPAPPPGPLTLILAWPAFHIDESSMIISGEELAAATARTVTLWPEQPEDQRSLQNRRPRPPAGSWFEENPDSRT